MKSHLTLLLTSAGRRAELINCFFEAARGLALELRVLAAEARPELSAACQLADGWDKVPFCREPGYVPALLELCRRKQVDLLVPTIDTELEVLAQHASVFEAAGTRIVVSAAELVAIARDKLATANFLREADVVVPRTQSLTEYRARPEALTGELLAKPIDGSSSVGLLRGWTAADFAALPEAGYLVQEFWKGSEFTVNLFFDQQGVLRCAVPHRRLEVRAGEVSKGRTERVPQLEDAARKIASAFKGARGPLCFQAIVRDSGDYAVFEINARFGGGYPLAHRAGAQFAKWLLEEAAGLPCSAKNDWKAGVTMLRYDAAVYIDG